MQTDPQTQHAWLQQLVGDWTYEGECLMGPGQPTAGFRGRETVRAVGGLWVVGDGEGEMPGGLRAMTMITLGFDVKSGRFVGTWIGSMSSHLWVYDGALDEGGRVLTLTAEGPDFTGQGMATYQDISEIVSPDERRFNARIRGADGEWTPFMWSTYRRVG